jgi:hydrogenase maturation protein HypF
MPMRSGLSVREAEYLHQVSDIGTLGVMVPYTPLHLLLFHHPEIKIPYSHLIMTSGNLKGEPIITDPAGAREKLAGAADLILMHNRRILFRTDDSVVRMAPAPASAATPATRIEKGQAETTRRARCLIRRSRGYVPHILKLKGPADTVTLALGGDLKSAPAFASGSDVYLAPYIGDLEGAEIITAFEEQIDKIIALYGIEPKRLVHDLHPGYVSTQWAADILKHRSGIGRSIEETIGVQHHHAHILSVMAEHGLDEVLGLSFDGTGYGTDGTIWGGEFLFAGRSRFTRLGRFAPFLLPGGDAAVRNPRRTAFAILTETGVRPGASPASAAEGTDIQSGPYEIGQADEALEASGLRGTERELVPEMVRKRINSPVTSSLGRIFDAAAAVLGLVDVVGYEGEGPMKLEGYAYRAGTAGRLGPLRPEKAAELLPLEERSGLFEIDPGPLLWYLAEEMKQTEQKRARIEELAAYFHQTIAYGALNGALTMRDKTGIKDIALSGGVFQNIYLLEHIVPLLEESGFNVYTNNKLPPGDGGIAVGQAYFTTG